MRPTVEGRFIESHMAKEEEGTPKQNSLPAFYDSVGVDFVKSEKEKLRNVAERVKLMPPRECDDIEAIKACGLPRLFIVNYYICIRIPLFLVLIPLTTTALTWSSTSP